MVLNLDPWKLRHDLVDLVRHVLDNLLACLWVAAHHKVEFQARQSEAKGALREDLNTFFRVHLAGEVAMNDESGVSKASNTDAWSDVPVRVTPAVKPNILWKGFGTAKARHEPNLEMVCQRLIERGVILLQSNTDAPFDQSVAGIAGKSDPCNVYTESSYRLLRYHLLVCKVELRCICQG